MISDTTKRTGAASNVAAVKPLQADPFRTRAVTRTFDDKTTGEE